jgi:hypothetical protein
MTTKYLSQTEKPRTYSTVGYKDGYEVHLHKCNRPYKEKFEITALSRNGLHFNITTDMQTNPVRMSSISDV